jgi:hypothetical protein
MRPKTTILVLVALAIGVIAGASVRSARADQESDLHRIAVASEHMARSLESIDRHLAEKR